MREVRYTSPSNQATERFTNMQLGETILQHGTPQQKLLLLLALLSSLKGVTLGLLTGLFLVLVLFVFGLLADALYELTSHIAQLWGQSDAITKLLMLVLAVWLVKTFSPYVVKLNKRLQ